MIEPQAGWSFPDLRELREYGGLVRTLVRRDIAVRYRQTAVGFLWAILQPLALAAVFGVFLGALANVPSQGDVPYALYVFTGMILWTYFQQAFQRASDSTIESGPLMAKVWFPRIVVPLVAVVSPLLDLAAGLVVLVPALFIFGYAPGVEVLVLPLVVLLALGTALGLGLWLSALHVRYRDVKQLVPFLLLVGLFITPITYPFDIVPEGVQPLYALNPLVGVLELFRLAIFGDMSGAWWVTLIPVATAAVFLVTGAMYYNRAQRDFADLI